GFGEDRPQDERVLPSLDVLEHLLTHAMLEINAVSTRIIEEEIDDGHVRSRLARTVLTNREPLRIIDGVTDSKLRLSRLILRRRHRPRHERTDEDDNGNNDTDDDEAIAPVLLQLRLTTLAYRLHRGVVRLSLPLAHPCS